MDSIVLKVRDFFDSFTPQHDLQDYWMVSGGNLAHLPPFIFAALYMLMIHYFPKIQSKYKFLHNHPIVMKLMFCAWNIFLHVYSAFSVVFFFTEVYNTVTAPQEKGRFFMASILCPMEQHYYEGSSAFWHWLFAISKFFELVDTFLLILKKPQRKVKFLHTYHHTTVLILTWIGVKNRFSGIILGGLMNTFVHTCMYLFFFLTEVNLRPPFAYLLTLLQIFQMIIGSTFSFYWIYLQFKFNCSCEQRWLVIFMIIVIYSSYLWLFVQFFISKYITKGKKKEKKEKNEKKEKKKH